MAAAKNTRARLAHKLAKYVRAQAVHHNPRVSDSLPSNSHLRFGGPQRRKVGNKSNTWYPSEDVKTHFKRARNQPKPSAGRKDVAPGSVVILLSGKHRGRRVVVLKRLDSGNYLVTGPHKINGVPLKRVNPAYFIRTSTSVSLDGVDVSAINEKFFKNHHKYRPSELKNATETRTNKVNALKAASQQWKKNARATQSNIDKALIANVKKVESLKEYLGTRFTLYNGTKPHELKF